MYGEASMVNHDCLPNVARFDSFDAPQGERCTALRLRALWDLPAGTELLMSAPSSSSQSGSSSCSVIGLLARSAGAPVRPARFAFLCPALPPLMPLSLIAPLVFVLHPSLSPCARNYLSLQAPYRHRQQRLATEYGTELSQPSPSPARPRPEPPREPPPGNARSPREVSIRRAVDLELWGVGVGGEIVTLGDRATVRAYESG